MSGRILAYQVGFTSIDSAHVDGVLVTSGPAGSRQHIGTFAAALYDEDPNYNSYYNCPCTDTRYSGLIIYLHSSRTTTSVILETLDLAGGTMYYSDDPLWNETREDL